MYILPLVCELELLCSRATYFSAFPTVFVPCIYIHPGFIRLLARSCRMHAFSNRMTSVTNLHLGRHPVKIGGRDLVHPLTAIALSKEENSLWKITLPPT